MESKGTAENQNDNGKFKNSKTTPDTEADNFVKRMYPLRRGEKPKFSDALIKGQGRGSTEKLHCERNVYNCISRNPLVKLLMNALKSAGCTVDIRRHITCEECNPSVSGGYDPVLNQIVICQNNVKAEGIIQGVLTHELIHLFDYCKYKLDLTNLDHLACTEIRAANLTQCSFVSAWLEGTTSIFNFQGTHEDCVKNKALNSILAVRNVSKEEANVAIERVFTKCYADLEPIGRRIRRNSDDAFRAYAEGPYYGYMS